MSSRLEGLVGRCRFAGYEFEVSREESHTFVRIVCHNARNSRTGAPTRWAGRKWRLSKHMTDGEVVQTCFLAAMVALEHEAREQFTFDGVTVFDPHFDVHKLVELRNAADAIVEREVTGAE